MNDNTYKAVTVSAKHELFLQSNNHIYKAIIVSKKQ